MSIDDQNIHLDKVVIYYVQKEEMEILSSSDFSLDLPTGINLLNMILKLSNDSYDFGRIRKSVSGLALEHIFSSAKLDNQVR